MANARGSSSGEVILREGHADPRTSWGDEGSVTGGPLRRGSPPDRKRSSLAGDKVPTGDSTFWTRINSLNGIAAVLRNVAGVGGGKRSSTLRRRSANSSIISNSNPLFEIQDVAPHTDENASSEKASLSSLDSLENWFARFAKDIGAAVASGSRRFSRLVTTASGGEMFMDGAVNRSVSLRTAAAATPDAGGVSSYGRVRMTPTASSRRSRSPERTSAPPPASASGETWAGASS